MRMEVCLSSGAHNGLATRTKGVVQLFVLLTAAVLPAFISGCSGAVKASTNGNTGGNSSIPQLSVLPSSINFSTVVVGQKNTQPVQLSNSGSATLTVQNIQISGTGFSATLPALPFSLAAGASQSVTLAFAPSAAGAATGTMTITSNDPNSPATLSLQGTGQSSSAQLKVTPTSINFGNTTVATTNSQAATLQNTGNAAVTITNVSVTGAGFGVSSLSSGLALSPQQQASFQVTFDPTVIGAATGSLSITGSGLAAPLTMALSGTGQSASNPHSVSLSWGASTSSVAGYVVYRSNVSGGPYTGLNSSPVTSLSYTDTSVTAGSTYYYVVTSEDSSGVQSVYSNQVSATIPTP
jgi:Abnormal spindle-like microcephaly-assoc'd, ASPM-SPD-2-Hydin/Cep192 domain 4